MWHVWSKKSWWGQTSLSTVTVRRLFVEMGAVSPQYTGWIMITAFTAEPVPSRLQHDCMWTPFTTMPSTVGSEWRAAGCLPLALGPAFTHGAPTICIIATPERTMDKQASGWTQEDTRQSPVAVCSWSHSDKHTRRTHAELCMTVYTVQLCTWLKARRKWKQFYWPVLLNVAHTDECDAGECNRVVRGVSRSEFAFFSPGRGMCMPGKGTLKGGTMTGGKAGMAVVGWATLWGRAAGSSGKVCTAVTGDGTVETVTTVTGDTVTVEVTVATVGRSATTEAKGNERQNKLFFYHMSSCTGLYLILWVSALTCDGHSRWRGGGRVWTGGEGTGGGCVWAVSRRGYRRHCCANCSVDRTGAASSCGNSPTRSSPRVSCGSDEEWVELRLLDDFHTLWFRPRWLPGPCVVVISL